MKLTAIVSKAIVLGAALVTSAAFAMPAVGDIANFSATIVDKSTSTPATLKMEIVGLDAATSNYTINQTVVVGTQTSNDSYVSAKNDLLDDATIAKALASCASYGGVAETITVPAGVFPTCHISQTDSSGTTDVWFGAVAFGYVKQIQTTPSQTTTLELSSFTMGL